MIKADLYGALSRGYCSEKNSSKTVDPDLIEAMADELLLLYCKTQGKLFEEKHCPYEQVSHGIGLDNKVSEIKISCKLYGGSVGTYLSKQEENMGTENKIHECKCEDRTTNYHLTVCEKGMKNDDHCLNIKDFQKDLEKLINCHSKENTSNTPDWVIASYLVRCLDVFDDCINLRERYYGRQLIKESIPNAYSICNHLVKPSETLTALLCGGQKMITYRVSIMIKARNKKEAEKEFYKVISGSQSLDLEIEGVLADKIGEEAAK